jgi:hypothetical protein
VIERQGTKLDIELIEEELKPLLALLEVPERLDTFRKMLK